MSNMTLQQVQNALHSTLRAPIIKYDESQDSFILMNLFFKALGNSGCQNMLHGLKKQLPKAEILNTWIAGKDEQSQCGYECVEFRV